ncbi:TRAP transporter permease [Nitratireductor aquimarinus]|uniref:TRAP transporter permease n=1 Tax=Alphaproteobacteria TaxID=28211 RepID=UPI0019D37C2E|nr:MULTISPECIES: TRAP transporter permease [Alphaproteobacteria]MBY6020473.1 TRAP transporter permease [Nitratireductor sp. DP7N14-4]MBN7755687.1 TRAP transporter permease [Nitratireductor aquimarinus]MBN7776053.1 TRAP transporter permease [Nitratireductor pacificus]MBN7780717.1 TRAP transporter permease [Nitratireductor pacificus]MBN7789523.1 TRAP transporter permease [Nitratireductor aquimarinus]
MATKPETAGKNSAPLNDDELQDLVASSDTGARDPEGTAGYIIAGVALCWSLFQLYIASPLPFTLTSMTGLPLVLNDAQSRAIHLAFGLFLAFMAFPALASSPRNRIPVSDWVLAIVAASCALYIFVFYRDLSQRPGLPITQDLVVAGIGMVLLLEATRRALGPPLAVVAIVFLLYVFFGSSTFVPDIIRWGGASFSRAMDQMWLSPNGVFGVALGVSSAFVFLFVLFGSMLDRAGAGNFFIKLAFALLGHLRGGPAKAAVLASMMTGLISGSSIANVVTTGTFTIPLMKRVGFSPEKAGSVEVASSVNGQIMPPVMGAAAFLMVEYVGIPYLQVIKHAFLPAVVSYIALLYLVHLEAVKKDMPVLEKRQSHPALVALMRSGIVISSIVILIGVIYYAINFIKFMLPNLSAPVLMAALLIAYVALIWYAAKSPDLEMDDPNAPVVELPLPGEVIRTGLHYLLPLFVLVWSLMVERKSPGLSAFYAVLLLIVIIVTQKPLKALFRGLQSADQRAAFKEGFDDLVVGLILGARNMIGIACATAAAGVIVGTVTLTGIGQVMAEFVEFLSGGNILLILVFTALISLVLGMGLPTTANYIVVSSLMAPVIVELGAANGVLIPLIAAHMFVFYFGIMADVTPPVGLASFAAAAVSGGDPIKTGFTAFFYSLRTVLLPFIFVFNTDLLLIDVSWAGAIWVTIQATVAMLIFAAATQGFFMARNRLWESAALLLVTFMLLRPGFFLDLVQPPYIETEPTKIFEAVAEEPDDAEIRFTIRGPNFDNPDEIDERTMAFNLGAAGEPGEARFEAATGLVAQIDGERVLLEEPFDMNSLAGKTLASLDFYADEPVQITSVEVSDEGRMPREIFYLPAALLLALVMFLQRRRGGTLTGNPKAGAPRSAEA